MFTISATSNILKLSQLLGTVARALSCVSLLPLDLQWTLGLILCSFIGLADPWMGGHLLWDLLWTALTTQGPAKRRLLACLWVFCFASADLALPDETSIEFFLLLADIHLFRLRHFVLAATFAMAEPENQSSWPQNLPREGRRGLRDLGGIGQPHSRLITKSGVDPFRSQFVT